MPRFIRFYKGTGYLGGVGLKPVSIMVIMMVIATLWISSVSADRGLIPVDPDVSVFEPGQQAIVAWNGREEILILSTNVISSEHTLVVELLPLPSEPQVEAASFSSFEAVQSLVWSDGTSLYYGKSGNEVRDASVEIVFHDQIGAHNITVAHATDATELLDWIENLLEAANVQQSFSFGDFEPVVKDYMSRGFRYYVLDLVDFLPADRSVDPILYRFDSNFLYYPLVITSPVEGSTEITLFLLTEGKVESDYQPMWKAVYQFALEGVKPIEFVVSKGELSKIDLRIAPLFDDMAWLTVLKYEGSQSYITEDLMLTQEAIVPATPSGQPVNVNVELAFPVTIIAAFMVSGAAIALIASFCTALLMRVKRNQPKTS